MSNLPTRNNNPGDLKDPKTGTFRKFSDPQSGFIALKNDLNAKITGNTSTGLNGKSSIKDFAYKYAPPSDNNDSEGYADKLAKKLGVSKDTPIGSLSNRLDDFASAIADNEGYQGNRVAGSTTSISPMKGESSNIDNETIKGNVLKLQNAGATPQDIETYVQRAVQERGSTGPQNGDSSPKKPQTFDDLIKDQKDIPQDEKQNLFQSAVGANPKDSVVGQITNNKVTRDLIDIVPGAKQLGNEIGTSLAYFGEKAKGFLGGQDNSKYIPESKPGEAIKGALKVMGTAASVAGPGIISELRSPLAAKEIAYNIPMEMSKFAKLGRIEKLNTLGEALKTAGTGDAEKIAEAIKYLKPSPSVVKSIISKGINTTSKYLLIKALGDKVGGLIHGAIGK